MLCVSFKSRDGVLIRQQNMPILPLPGHTIVLAGETPALVHSVVLSERSLGIWMYDVVLDKSINNQDGRN